MPHRPLCEKCPWRDMDAMRTEFPNVVADAEAHGGDGYVCHTRMGPCDGPKVMLAKETASA